jgi:glycosyltransferase involved in cell wall biosynthesis
MGNTGQKPITLSICMMVKDEEANLKRCLPSLKGIADELIIVDTGSTDTTMELAKSFGAKVYEHPFKGAYIDDFSKYRNLSVGYATSDWLLIVDADEELLLEDSSSAPDLKSWLSKIHPECSSAAITLRDIQQDLQVMQFPSVRLFRKDTVQYEKVIHNTPKIIKGKPEAVFCPVVSLKHYGYDLTPERQMDKRKRTEGLLFKQLEKDPDDVVAIFYLIQSYTAADDYTEAAKYVERYAETSARTGVEFNGSIYCTATHVYRKLMDKKNAQKWLLAGLKEYPGDLDLLMNLTEYGVWVQDIDLMARGAKGFLKAYAEYQKNPIAGGNRFVYANTPESACYCMFHLAMGMLQQGCQVLDKLGSVLEDTKPEYQAGVRGDVGKVLSVFGVHRDGWDTPLANEPRKVVNLSSRR